MNRLHRFLLAAALPLLAATAAQAQDCSFKERFKYPDGSLGCIGDLSFAKESTSGWASSVVSSVPTSGLYSVAISARKPECKTPVVGMVYLRGNVNGIDKQLPANTPEGRAERAISECQAKLKSSGDSVETCGCKLVLQDGVAAFSRGDFQGVAGK